MSDHPDIDKLPEEIGGIAVQEILREFFREPSHGTPDNISKAGCLALALKSNEVGGYGRWHLIWNAWRQQFPSVHLKSGVFVNAVDFSKIDFRPFDLNFSYFVFGDAANFRCSRWGDHASFEGANWGDFARFDSTQWGNGSNFHGAQWGHQANFMGAYWGDWTNFCGARWGNFANFIYAQWGVRAYFGGAQWGNFTKFVFAQWGNFTNFEGAQWGDKFIFQGARWIGDVDFSAMSWDALKEVYRDETLYQRVRAWAEERGISSSEFMQVDFSGATFLGDVRFVNRRFTGAMYFGLLHSDTSRDHLNRDEQGQLQLDEFGIPFHEKDLEQHRHTKFSKPPIFHGCELHQDTSFDGAEFPPATGSEAAARAYRTLKLAFSKQQAIREEQRFFRLEMEEETLRETGLKRWLFKAYKTFSDYGFSVVRPLLLLALSWLLFAAVYGWFSTDVASGALQLCASLQDSCHVQWEWLQYSLQQALPLPGFEKLVPSIPSVPIGWLALHKTLSLAALFLIGLALRNLFKLK